MPNKNPSPKTRFKGDAKVGGKPPINFKIDDPYYSFLQSLSQNRSEYIRAAVKDRIELEKAVQAAKTLAKHQYDGWNIWEVIKLNSWIITEGDSEGEYQTAIRIKCSKQLGFAGRTYSLQEVVTISRLLENGDKDALVEYENTLRDGLPS